MGRPDSATLEISQGQRRLNISEDSLHWDSLPPPVAMALEASQLVGLRHHSLIAKTSPGLIACYLQIPRVLCLCGSKRSEFHVKIGVELS